jgi:16S rRNA (cytosine967-C5)-methyltransferase
MRKSLKKHASAAENILNASASAIGMIDRGECTLDDYLDRHAPPEFRRTVEHLLLAFYRRRGFFCSELNRLVSRTPDSKVRNLLFAVFTQIRFQDAIAPESAVSIAVDAAKKFHADKFVNAVLRRFIADSFPISSHPQDVLPSAIFKRWKMRYSEETLRHLSDLFTAEPPFSFRMEKGTQTVDFDCSPIRQESLFDFYTADSSSVLKSRALADGKIYIQDPATGYAPSLPDYSSVKSAVDICAAPGGKSLMISENLPGDGNLTAFDRSAKRQILTRRNFEKRGLPHKVLSGDLKDICGSFDLVLADVPCSNTGVFRHRPDALWRFSEKDLNSVVLLQQEILEHAARLTSPGGQLVYSTCSLEPEEKILMVKNFISRHPDFVLQSGDTLLPGELSDGASAFLLRRFFSR